MKKALKLLLLVVTLSCFTIAGSAAATAAPGGQFTVTEAGVQLTDDTFPDGGHVNIQSEPNGYDLHFEGKCIERTDAECAGSRHDMAQYIGKSFIPWSAFGLSGSFCIKWVQVANYNYHFGENGEKPLCINPPTEEPPVEEPPVEEPPTEEPPVEEPPAEQPPREVRWVDTVDTKKQCDADKVWTRTISSEETRDYVLADDGTWQPGAWVPTGITKVTETFREATEFECPAGENPPAEIPPVNEWKPDLEKPTLMEPKPQPIATVSDKVPTLMAAKHPAVSTPMIADPVPVLAKTGADDWLMIGTAALVLIALGSGSMLVARRQAKK